MPHALHHLTYRPGLETGVTPPPEPLSRSSEKATAVLGPAGEPAGLGWNGRRGRSPERSQDGTGPGSKSHALHILSALPSGARPDLGRPIPPSESAALLGAHNAAKDPVPVPWQPCSKWAARLTSAAPPCVRRDLWAIREACRGSGIRVLRRGMIFLGELRRGWPRVTSLEGRSPEM